MTKILWQRFISRLSIDTWASEVSPVPAEELYKFEEKHGAKLPQSYRTYCETFGAGCFDESFPIAVPGLRKSATMYSLDALNELARNREYKHYAKDPEQHERGIFFGSDILGALYFFDPAEVTDRRRHEYGIYVLFRDWAVKRTADTFWEFITEWCLGKKRRRLMTSRGMRQLFTPAAL